MRPILYMLLGLSLGAWAQNAVWDLQNLAFDWGLWFTFLPVVPAFVCIAMMRRAQR